MEYLHLDLGTSSEVRADLEYYTYHCRSRRLLVLSRSRRLLVLSLSRSRSRSLSLSFSFSFSLILARSDSPPLVLFSSSRILVLSSSRSVLSDSRILILSHCCFLAAFSWILEFSSLVSPSRSLVLSSVRPLGFSSFCRIVVLSERSLGFSSSCILSYSFSRLLVLSVAHSLAFLSSHSSRLQPTFLHCTLLWLFPEHLFTFHSHSLPLGGIA
jgi:hypothetical protein